MYPDSRRFPPARQITNAKKNDITLGLFLFGTDRVGEFLEKGFNFISIGNDLHHIQTVPPRPPPLRHTPFDPPPHPTLLTLTHPRASAPLKTPSP